MRVTRAAATRTCAVCERTLLMGEHTTRYAPDASGYVDVCPLCHEVALEHGWLREGSPTSPTVPLDLRRRRKSWSSLLGGRRAEEAPVAPDPILRRLSGTELEVVEAADLFNGSAYRRTVSGIAKSLGPPQASIVPLSGVSGEMVITVAWEISWYQYRVTPESSQPVRLAERGHDVDDLEGSFREWNAQLADDGRLMPNLARV
ncbi:MAG: hypothetical protein H0U07_14475 [Actinobacteria bacterium]|nr:hypothetical protein [Actinomycetota bacterium]MDQ3164054.1 hypothetical protein [Actinomycetota bacterium]